MSNETLPDCMMPDGAQPCVGFSLLEDKARAAAAILGDGRLLPNAKLAAVALIMHGGRLTRIEIARRIRAHDCTMTRVMQSLTGLGLVSEIRSGVRGAKTYRWIGEIP
jgi:DNA-binding transcriptional ArsR family regulator